MKPSEISLFLNATAAQFLDGDADRLTQHFSLPLPIYFKDSMQIVTNRDTLKRNLMTYRAALLSRGADSLSLAGLQIDDQSEDRGLVLAKWAVRDAYGDKISSFSTRYVLRFGASKHWCRIELVEYVERTAQSIDTTLSPSLPTVPS